MSYRIYKLFISELNCNVFLILLVYLAESKNKDVQKTMFCNDLKCDDTSDIKVCGIRTEVEGFRLKLFDNECQLLKYGCEVENNKTYGIINLEYCVKTFQNDSYQKLQFDNEIVGEPYINVFDENQVKDCSKINCALTNGTQRICGIRKHGVGFKIRPFDDKCELMRYNCDTNLRFVETDMFICDVIKENEYPILKNYKTETADKVHNEDVIRNVVIVNTNMLDYKNDINATIGTFFAATHVLDLPVREVAPDLVDEITRRRLINVAGPVKVFQPWITIPSNISDDRMHSPTLSSCYHKCPMKCPDTYAPVCGVPGIVAREPSLMFQNHCFMDVAQCKMRWEDKSATAISSSYIESSFMFCLGDQLNAMYRFLPLVRTLQHMGRLKKKGRFNFRLRNLRFFNSLLSRDPKLMG